MLTSALAGLALTASAIAQTTITGEIRVNHKAVASEATTATPTSGRGFGTEQQINVQTKGKTNIGWDYAAGFSLENDGEQATTLYNEKRKTLSGAFFKSKLLGMTKIIKEVILKEIKQI